MKSTLSNIIGIAAATILFVKPALAEDIDLFAGGSNTPSMPNIMFVLDNSSNWNSKFGDGSTKFDSEVLALKAVMDKLGECDISQTTEKNAITCQTNGTTLGNTLKLGLMMYASGNGGYVRFSARVMNNTNRLALKDLVNNLFISGNATDKDDTGSSQPIGATFFELFKYFGGYTSPAKAYSNTPGATISSTAFGPIAFAGLDDRAVRRDYPSNTSATNRAAAYYGAEAKGAALDDSSATSYNSPISDGCAKNFAIFISNGKAQDTATSGNPKTIDLLTNVGGNTEDIIIPGTSTVATASFGDEFARFLYETDVSPIKGKQNVITYSLAAYDESKKIVNTVQEQIIQAQSIARSGGGKYFSATNSETLIQSLLSILNEIQAVNSTFVTASLPVNTNAQGEFLNQVFIGMFRPDDNGPRWWGNVKQYRLACINTDGTESSDCKCVGTLCPSVELVDSATPAVAINSSATGFVIPTAKSYWTSASTFWTNDNKGTPASASDWPDGEVVEKGGAAQRLRTVYATNQTSRKIYTCASPSCFGNDLSAAASKTAFDTTSSTGSAFSATDVDAGKFFASSSLLEPEPTPATPTIPKYSSLTNTADRVTALNKLIQWVRGTDNAGDEKGPGSGTNVRPSIHGDVIHSRPVAIDYGGTTGVVIFYATNDGLLHAAKGSQTASDGGNELWSFVATEFYSKLNRLRVNSPLVKVPTTPSGIVPTPLPKDYGFDGPITAFKASDGTIYLYVTARRGGALMYAFDITDITKPKVLWKIDQSTTGFSQLGMTFSAPTLLNLKKSPTAPILVFGGGYAGGYDSSGNPVCEDSRTSGASSCTVGNGIYFVNATSGVLIKQITSGYMGNATQAMNFSVPSDIYPMDSNFDGFVDRIYVGDLGGYLWRIEVDDADASNWTARVLASFGDDKKFFYRPAILQQKEFTAVAIGSGDREKPLVNRSTDYFYLVKDTSNGILGIDDRIVVRTPNDLKCASATNGCSSSATVDTLGWQRKLEVGEKVVNSPRVAFGIMNFATNKPTGLEDGQCSNLGEARAYELNALGGSSGATALSTEFIKFANGGLPPTAFVGTVKISDSVTKTVVIGGGTGQDGGPCVGPTCAQSKTLDLNPVRTRKYRYNKVDGN